MIKNFFTVALRNFWQHRVFSFINILGLSIGISASLVIYLIVQYEFSYERFRPDGSSIYRVVTDMSFGGETYNNSGVPSPLPETVRSEARGLQESSAFYLYNTSVTIPSVKSGTPVRYREQKNIVFADDHYFKLFNYAWLAGSQNALNEPFHVVLTESRAKLYFPNDDVSNAIGKTITYSDSLNVTVAGVVKDVEDVTDLTFKEFISYSTIKASWLRDDLSNDEWGSVTSSMQYLIKLDKGTSVASIEKQLVAIRKKYNKDTKDNSTFHHLQALYDIHFNPKYDNFDQRNGSKPVLYGLLAVAAFLLLLGCINFINLTTAQAGQRAKEIGIRKTMGSSKLQLIVQFLSETFLLTLMATLLSLLLAPLILQLFKDFTPAGLQYHPFAHAHVTLFLIGLVIVVSLFAGFYPAIVLSGFQPVTVLKNQAHAGTSRSRKSWLRMTLSVSQFVIAQVFIMGTIIVGKQIHYALSKDMGFRKDAIITFSIPFTQWRTDKKYVMLEKLKSLPGIEMVSLGSNPPSSNNTTSRTMKYVDGKKELETDVQIKYGDTNYVNLYKLRLLAGRNIAQSDTSKEYLINETYAHTLGFSKAEDAVGAVITETKIPVVGVVGDFNQRSIHTPIKPLIITSDARSHGVFHIALQTGSSAQNWQATIRNIEREWKQLFPDEPFEYKFYDKSIESFYKSEQDISRLLNWATGLAIFISCLGLLGLVIYTTHMRTKEIGVRKVLGATVSQLVSLLSMDLLKLVLLSFILAVPISWWVMHWWLQNFAYRTTVSWWIFLAGGLIMMIIALLTISVQTIKSAMTNPVKNLRTE